MAGPGDVTPLMLACAGGEDTAALVETLLDYEADPKAEDKNGWTATRCDCRLTLSLAQWMAEQLLLLLSKWHQWSTIVLMIVWMNLMMKPVLSFSQTCPGVWSARPGVNAHQLHPVPG